MKLRSFVLLAIFAGMAFSFPIRATANSETTTVGVQDISQKSLGEKKTWLQRVDKLFGAGRYNDSVRPGVPRTATTMGFDRAHSPAVPLIYTPVKVAGSFDDSTTIGWIDHHIFGVGSIDVPQRHGIPRSATTMPRDLDLKD